MDLKSPWLFCDLNVYHQSHPTRSSRRAEMFFIFVTAVSSAWLTVKWSINTRLTE